MSEPKNSKHILKRALGGFVFCVGILLASSCGMQNNAQAPDNYWESHYYQAPAAHMRNQYYGWGQSWQNYYQYTPSLYYIPIYYLYFYPPWVFQLSQSTYYNYAPSWYS